MLVYCVIGVVIRILLYTDCHAVCLCFRFGSICRLCHSQSLNVVVVVSYLSARVLPMPKNLSLYSAHLLPKQNTKFILINFTGSLELGDESLHITSLDGLKATPWIVERSELCCQIIDALNTYAPIIHIYFYLIV